VYNYKTNTNNRNERFDMVVKYNTLRAVRLARNPNDDVKMGSNVIDYRTFNTSCTLPGCTDHLTVYKGPGSNSLCRKHQLMQREYGGHGRLDRPYTFWKKEYCEDCGHSPMKHNKQIKALPQPYRQILGMMMLHVDHLAVGGKSKYAKGHGVNHPSNLKTLCQECHMLKTYTSGDHWAAWHGEK